MWKTLYPLFERNLDKLEEEINLYPDDHSMWKILPGTSNSGGNLCLHLCGNLRHFIGAQIGYSAYVRDRASEFSQTGLSKSTLSDLIQKTKSEVLSTLKETRVSPSEICPFKFVAQQVTYEHLMFHLYGHLHYHLGQLNYHRRAMMTNFPVN